MRPYVATVFLLLLIAQICIVSASLFRSANRDRIIFDNQPSFDKFRVEHGSRHVKPRPLEPFDSSDYEEEGDQEEKELIGLLRRIYYRRAPPREKDYQSDGEGVFFK